MLFKLLPAFVIFISAQCYSQVHQSDLNAWKRIHVDALDKHVIWSKVASIRSVQKDMSEKRIYVNRVVDINNKKCFDQGLVKKECRNQNPCLKGLGDVITEAQMDEYLICSEKMFGCDNIFTIKDSLVLSYSPVGYCFTNSLVRPDIRYKPIPASQEVIPPSLNSN